MSQRYRSKQSNAYALPQPIRPIAPYVVAFLAFFLICLCSPSSVKGIVCFLLPTAFAAGCWRFKRLREQLRPPLIALTLVVLMDLISTFYAVSGKFALNEVIKVMAAFSIVILLLTLAPSKEETSGRHIAALLARTAAFMSLVSIDLISTRWVSGLLLGILNCFNSDYIGLSGVEVGTRMTSMFDAPNVFAGIAGIGVLLSLGLVLSSTRRRERMSHLAVLFVNALAFVLAFSMGATGVIAVAFVLYLILERKEKRAALFVVMVETLAVTMVGVVLVSMTAFDAWDGVQPIPLLCTVVGAVCLCLLDRLVGERLAGVLSKHGKSFLLIIAGLILALLVFGVAAFQLTGAAELAVGEGLRRSAYPDAGAYTVSAEVSGAVSVTIESQNQEETMMHTSTVLYQGTLSEAVFTVPEDSLVVYFNFYAEENVQLERVSFSGENGEGEIPLAYKLLPAFIANRLQGLFANQNAIQRTVFFQDGLKLFLRSPVIGLGIGSYENGILSVQSFFYETKYAHNHYIQALTETGVIGLLLFVLLLVVSAVAVLRARRRETFHPLTPALGAALVFMAGHAAVEVVFSYFAYLPFAFGVFALINLCCADALPEAKAAVRVKYGVLGGIAAILAVFFVQLCGNLTAAKLFDANPSFATLERAAELDPYEWADYMLSYIISVSEEDEPEIQAKALEYAAKLEKVNSNTVPLYLAEFYFRNGEVEHGMAMIEKYVDYVSSKTESWQQAFDLLEVYELDSEEYRAGVAHIAQLLERWNSENMGEIVLSDGTLAFLERLGV